MQKQPMMMEKPTISSGPVYCVHSRSGSGVCWVGSKRGAGGPCAGDSRGCEPSARAAACLRSAPHHSAAADVPRERLLCVVLIRTVTGGHGVAGVRGAGALLAAEPRRRASGDCCAALGTATRLKAGFKICYRQLLEPGRIAEGTGAVWLHKGRPRLSGRSLRLYPKAAGWLVGGREVIGQVPSQTVALLCLHRVPPRRRRPCRLTRDRLPPPVPIERCALADLPLVTEALARPPPRRSQPGERWLRMVRGGAAGAWRHQHQHEQAGCGASKRKWPRTDVQPCRRLPVRPCTPVPQLELAALAEQMAG
jgi:hypothetical protein